MLKIRNIENYKRMKKILPILAIIITLFSCKGKTEKDKQINHPDPYITPIINYTYLNSYPHDTTSFTEGLLIHNGEFYESTGAMEGLPQTRSLFGVLDLNTGKIETKVELNSEIYFGEGITFLNGKVYQLTYKSKTGFVYDATTFSKLREFTFPSEEGWGMTTNGENLIMSDGTNTLTFLNPNTLAVVKTLAVSENGYAKDYLNELEYINGYIYANIWGTTSIAKIDIGNGNIVGEINLLSLAQDSYYNYQGSLEMNGIAYDTITDIMYVTGKMWPKVYQIKLD